MPPAGAAKSEDASGSLEVAKATIFDESLKCTMCMELCNRPVTVRPSVHLILVNQAYANQRCTYLEKRNQLTCFSSLHAAVREIFANFFSSVQLSRFSVICFTTMK